MKISVGIARIVVLLLSVWLFSACGHSGTDESSATVSSVQSNVSPVQKVLAAKDENTSVNLIFGAVIQLFPGEQFLDAPITGSGFSYAVVLSSVPVGCATSFVSKSGLAPGFYLVIGFASDAAGSGATTVWSYDNVHSYTYEDVQQAGQGESAQGAVISYTANSLSGTVSYSVNVPNNTVTSASGPFAVPTCF